MKTEYNFESRTEYFKVKAIKQAKQIEEKYKEQRYILLNSNKKQETRNKKQETRNKKQEKETRNKKQKTRNKKTKKKKVTTINNKQ